MKLKHMVLLLTFTLSFSLMSFNATKAKTAVAVMPPGDWWAVWEDPNNVYPDVYFYSVGSGGTVIEVGLDPNPPTNVLWSGDITDNGPSIIVDGFVITGSGTIPGVSGTLPKNSY